MRYLLKFKWEIGEEGGIEFFNLEHPTVQEKHTRNLP